MHKQPKSLVLTHAELPSGIDQIVDVLCADSKVMTGCTQEALRAVIKSCVAMHLKNYFNKINAPAEKQECLAIATASYNEGWRLLQEEGVPLDKCLSLFLLIMEQVQNCVCNISVAQDFPSSDIPFSPFSNN